MAKLIAVTGTTVRLFFGAVFGTAVAVSTLLLLTVSDASADGQVPGKESSDEDFCKLFVDSLRRRENLIASASFRWTEEYTLAAGMLRGPDGQPMPKHPVKRSGLKSAFRFDHDRFSFSYFVRDTLDSNRIVEASTHSYDGEMTATYDPAQSLPYGQGHIYKSDGFREFQNFCIWPFLLSFRAMPLRGSGLSAAKLELVRIPGSGDQDSANADLVFRLRVPNSQRTFAVDKQKDYQLRWFKQEHVNVTATGTKITPDATLEIHEYIDDPIGVAVPSKWSLRYYMAGGKIAEEVLGRVDEYELNPVLDPKTFTLYPFPPGTLVIDDRNNTTSWQRDGGALELVRTPKNDVTKPAQALRHMWFVLINAALFITLFLAWLWKHKSRR